MPWTAAARRKPHDSFFAPQYRALENYGSTEPAPSVEELIDAGQSAIAWHRAELAKGCSASLARIHEDRIEYIRGELASIQPLAAAE